MKSRTTVLVLMALVAAAVLVVPLALAQDRERDERREFRPRREREDVDRDERRERGEHERREHEFAERRERERAEHRDREEHERHEREMRERMRAHEGPMAEMDMMMAMIERMTDVCFNPRVAAMTAIGGMKDDVRRDPKEMIRDFERELARTRTLGLRNAIRMTLKELYQHTGQHEKVLDVNRAMLRENDEAIAEGCDDEDDDDDDR